MNDWPKEYKKGQGKNMIDKIRKIKRTIPARFYCKTFGNFDKKKNPGGFDTCRSYAKNFIENLKSGRGLFITGTVGTGKTHLVVAIVDYIARLLKRKGSFKIIFVTAIDLLSEIKYSYDKNNTEDIINNFETCNLLIIDDLGIEKTTDWTHELFYKIIDSRYSNLLPVIITTNLTDIEIKDKLSERIISRIYEMCKGIKLAGKDYRLK
jgi:DNA replication protein DnaC